MKKIFTILSVGAIACLSAMATINWDTVDNLAQGASVVTSSNEVNASNIVDGNNGTGWQALAATHQYTHDWAIIDLGETKTFTDMEIAWEASHCKKFSIYTSDNEIPYTAKETESGIKYNEINADWLAANTAVTTGGNDSEANYTDNINFTEPQTAQYILIYADEYNNFGNQYGMFIYDVKIANIQGRDNVSNLQITTEGKAVAGGEALTVTITPQNVLGETMPYDKISDLTLTCDNNAVTITPAAETGKYQVNASKFGDYTLTATAKSGEATLTNTISIYVAYNWNNIENLATSKTIQGRVIADKEDQFPPKNAVDGNIETYYQYNGEWGGGDSWLLVDLGDEYMISAIGAYYTNLGVNSKCVFGYATDATEIEAKIAADGTDYVWKNDNDFAEINKAWTFTDQLNRYNDIVTTYEYAAPVTARYIVVKDADNPGGKPCVNEIYVKGVKHETSVATSIEVSADNNYVVTGTEITLSATVYDQYGAVMPDQAVTFTCPDATIENGKFTPTNVGDYTVTANLTGETLITKDITIYVVASAEDSKLSAADVTKVTLNDQNIEPSLIFNDYTIPVFPATLKIDLNMYYVFKLIDIRWEAACPSDYTVDVTTDKGTFRVLTVSDRKFEAGVFPVDKIVNSNYVAPELANSLGEVAFADLTYVKSMTINITGRDHGYNIRLFGIDAYSDTDKNTGVDEVSVENNTLTDVYNLQGIKVRSNVETSEALQGLPRGIYIVGGRKVIL